jgi:hypothetical protein
MGQRWCCGRTCRRRLAVAAAALLAANLALTFLATAPRLSQRSDEPTGEVDDATEGRSGRFSARTRRQRGRGGRDGVRTDAEAERAVVEELRKAVRGKEPVHLRPDRHAK